MEIIFKEEDEEDVAVEEEVVVIIMAEVINQDEAEVKEITKIINRTMSNTHKTLEMIQQSTVKVMFMTISA